MALLSHYLRCLMLACGCLAVGMLSGCRNLDNAQVDVLERELRQQEDYIYELEDYLIEYSEKLRHARMAQCPPGQSNSKGVLPAPRSPLREPTLDEDPVTRPSLPLNGRNKLTAPPSAPNAGATSEAPPASTRATSEAPTAAPDNAPPAAPATSTTEEVDPETLQAPELQIGPVGAADTSSSPVAAGPLVIPDPVDYQADSESPPSEAVAATDETAAEPQLAAPQNEAPRLVATELKIRKIFRQPAADKSAPGSLLVVVEAVNATDEPVDAIGAASIMVMAQDETGKPKKVERWDFSAEETKAAWQSSHLGDGLHLELPLTKPELPEGELELWARVVGDDGAKLLTSAEAPCRFQAIELASLDDVATETSVASKDLTTPPATQGSAPTLAASTESTEAENRSIAETPGPKWRASSTRLDAERVEGFASTAGNKPASWTTKPIDASGSRVASAPAKGDTPKWKRSVRASHADSGPAWSAER